MDSMPPRTFNAPLSGIKHCSSAKSIGLCFFSKIFLLNTNTLVSFKFRKFDTCLIGRAPNIKKIENVKLMWPA